ncbi:Lipoxygenase y domain-containing protein 1 [Bulinus truncatus]|nr:Lipoxygenase y domain-containing protein 1 [Bulinus truncatus]
MDHDHPTPTHTPFHPQTLKALATPLPPSRHLSDRGVVRGHHRRVGRAEQSVFFPLSTVAGYRRGRREDNQELLVNVGPREIQGYPFVITVKTGDKANAGTDARVYIIMYGPTGQKNAEETSGKIWLDSSGKFERNQTDLFRIEVAKMISPLSKIEIGHDNSGAGPGWYLDSVTIYSPTSGIEQFFPCRQWFAKDEGDHLIQRILYEQTGLRKKREREVSWQAWVQTSDKRNAGTDANVYVCIYGDKGKSDDIKLDNKGDNFEQGKTDTFRFSTPELGKLYKIRVWHDNAGAFAGWHLEKIELQSLESKEKFTFNCNRWLAEDEDDKEIVREIPAEAPSIKKPLPLVHYTIQVHTGKKKMAGTDANVYINVFGDRGDTGNRFLKYSKTNKNKFENGQMDEFEIEAVSLSKLRKIRIGHDGAGVGSGWFLDKVVVIPKEEKEKYGEVIFTCNRWLDTSQDDGLIEREITASGVQMLSTTTYHVSVKTGDERGAGTDANVSLKIFGTNGDTGSLQLRQSENSTNKFERGKTDLFKLEATDIGKIKKIKIGHDNKKLGSDWYLEEVSIDIPSKGEHYNFPCRRWLNEKDGLEVELDPVTVQTIEKTIPYEVTIWTGDKKGAGTDANVFLQMYGKSGKTQEIQLRNKSDNFEQNQMDKFKVEAPDLGPLQKIRIGHDGVGMMSGWYLEKMCIQREAIKTKGAKRRLSQQGKSKSKTSLSDDDSDPDSSPSLRRRRSNFKGSNSQMYFSVSSHVFLLLLQIELQSLESKEKFTFNCNRWLAEDEEDKEIVREIPAEAPSIKKPLPLVHYTIQVHTGKKKMAGTDANVYINVFGDRGDTGNRFLKYSKTNKNKFENGQMDEFEIEAVSLSKLRKIRIGHDGTGVGSGWFLDKVVVIPKEEKEKCGEVIFTCNRWLDTSQDDGLIEREITASGVQMLSTTTYHVSVKTGDERGAGTDANVNLKIFGTNGDTGSLQLRQSENSTNKFERGKTDLFKLEATDIGKIKKIKIGHDNKKLGSDWYLEEVSIDIPSKGEHYNFPCRRWLNEKDGLEVELDPVTVQTIEKTIPYEVTIWTGDKKGAGTDANVFLQMYGKSGKTQEIQLRNKSDNFEQNQMDKFKVEAPDLGPLQKIRIGHDGVGMMSGWYLEKMCIQREAIKTKGAKRRLSHQGKSKSKTSLSDDDSDPDSSPSPRRRRSNFKGSKSRLDAVKEEDEEDIDIEEYWFFVNKWFAKGEGDKLIVRELVPTDKEGRPLHGSLQEVEYTVKVHTGDVSYAGTDANVFVTLYGENGDTGERHLKDSATNMNKFERNQEDVFIIKAVDLGKLVKVNVRHDNKGGGADWFLDNIEVEDTKRKLDYFFPCQRWLAVSKDDGQLSRDLMPVDKALKKKLQKRDSKTSIRDEIALEVKAALTTYHVKVFTGDKFGAGTDANVYVVLFGEKDHTNKLFLKSSLTNKNKFERNQMDEFILELANIGELKKIKIGHDNAGGGGAWFLDKVLIDAPSLGRAWSFPCGHWLSDSDEDRKLERELYPQELATEEYAPCIPYEITTYTSNLSGAGTDAMVHVTLYGKEKATDKKNLCSSKKECKSKFNKGSVDKFIVEMEDVGESIEKLRIGHDDSGFGAAWHLEKVEVRRLHNSGKGSVTYTFPCNRWLAKNEDDGAIERELLPVKAVQEVVGRDGETKAKELKLKDTLESKKYTVEVYTGDMSGGGTDANVFITLFGDKGDSGERQLRNSETNKDKFERNKMDRFILEAVDLGNLYKIKIRHDNSFINPSWFLDRVEISEGRDKYVFHCERWLAKNKDDGKIERTLYVKGYDGDMSSTGTLKSTRFGGSVASLESMRTSDTFSKSPRVTRKQLATLEEDVPYGPTIPYTIKVSTGDGNDHGTSSNVWVDIFGLKKKHTGKMYLELLQKERFEPGSVETFSLEAVDVVEVKKIMIGHDGTAPGSGWYLKDLELDLPTKGKHYHFECKQWLARDKGDGKTSREFSVDDGKSSVTSYKPNSKILMTVFGLKGTSSVIELEKREDRFERARTNLLKMEIDDVAPLKKIRLELQGKGSRPCWFLEKMELMNMETGVKSVFKYNNWIGQGKEGAKNPVDIPATEMGKIVVEKTNYKVMVKTSDVSGAGTDANIYIILFGAFGDSGEIHLKNSETHKHPFERNQEDVFTIKNILSLGELSKLRVWHDNKGIGAAWHLASIKVEDEKTGKVFTFVCDKWLSKSEDDKQIIRELTCNNTGRSDSARSSVSGKDQTVYEIEVTTTDKKEGGTMHNGWIILEGKQGTSKVFQLKNSAQNKILRRGTTNNFSFPSKFLGKLQYCFVGAFERDDVPIGDAEGRSAMWHCHEVAVTDSSTGVRYIFPCQDWIDIHRKIRPEAGKKLIAKKIEESQVTTTRNLAPVKYEIVVVTGNEKSAGTDANVFITVFGTNGDTGKRALTQKFKNLFERNQTDKFQIEALDLGELTKVKIEHDNSSLFSSWFLDRVEIINMASNVTTVFPCGKWLSKRKGDGQIARELFPQN